MNQHIRKLLASPTGAEAEVIKNLNLTGNGDLRIGVRNVWGNGISVGAVAVTAVLGGGCLIYWLTSRKRRVLKTVETVGTAFNAGFEVGKRQEREFREYMEERDMTSLN